MTRVAESRASTIMKWLMRYTRAWSMWVIVRERDQCAVINIVNQNDRWPSTSDIGKTSWIVQFQIDGFHTTSICYLDILEMLVSVCLATIAFLQRCVRNYSSHVVIVKEKRMAPFCIHLKGCRHKQKLLIELCNVAKGCWFVRRNSVSLLKKRMSSPCVSCLDEPDTKPKPGLFPCLGCNRMYCLPHAAAHRQELSNELDVVIGERNELQTLFELREGLPDVSIQMNTIDQWVQSTIDQVNQTADKAREHIRNLAHDSAITIKDQYAKFTENLDCMRQNESYFEKDIAKLKQECTQLKAGLDHLNVRVYVTSIFRKEANPIKIEMDNDRQVVQSKPEPEEQKPKKEEREPLPSLSYIEELLKDGKPFKQMRVSYDNGSLCFGDQMALMKNPSREYTLIDLANDELCSTSWHSKMVDIVWWSPQMRLFIGRCMVDSKSIILLSLDSNSCQNLPLPTDGAISHIACFEDELMVLSSDNEGGLNIEEFVLTSKRTNSFYLIRFSFTTKDRKNAEWRKRSDIAFIWLNFSNVVGYPWLEQNLTLSKLH